MKPTVALPPEAALPVASFATNSSSKSPPHPNATSSWSPPPLTAAMTKPSARCSACWIQNSRIFRTRSNSIPAKAFAKSSPNTSSSAAAPTSAIFSIRIPPSRGGSTRRRPTRSARNTESSSTTFSSSPVNLSPPATSSAVPSVSATGLRSRSYVVSHPAPPPPSRRSAAAPRLTMLSPKTRRTKSAGEQSSIRTIPTMPRHWI